MSDRDLGVLQEGERSWCGDGKVAITVLVGMHFLLLMCFFAPAISTPDANGYLAQARLIAMESRSDIMVASPAQYVGDHWMLARANQYYGQYPPGLPAILAIVYRSAGPNASLYVIPMMGSFSLLALFLVVRHWVGPAWGLLAALLMAVNPFGNAHALGADSHTAVCFFLMWGLFGLAKWDQTRGAGWSAFAGLCLGMIPTIRYPETLFVLACAGYVVMTWRQTDGYRSLIVGIIGAGLPMIALAVRNQVAFGAFWKTGYSISGEQTGFGPGYFVMYAIPYLFLTLTIGVGYVMIVGIRGMVALCKRQDTKRQGQLLVGLTLPITLLYMAYYWRPGHNSMRFLLPTFFIYTIAAVWFLKLRTDDDFAGGRRQTKIVLIVTLIWGLPLSIFELLPLRHDNQVLADVTLELQKYVEPGSVLLAQSGLQQHLDFVGGWKLAPEESFDRQARPAHPVGPRMGRPEDQAAEIEILSPLERSEAFRNQLADWSGGRHKVYWITTEDRLKSVSSRFHNDDEWVRVADIAVSGRGGGPPPERGGPERRAGKPRFEGPRRGWLGWGGPPPRPPGDGDRLEEFGPPGGGGPMPPARFHVPGSGKLVLVEWKIRDSESRSLEDSPKESQRSNRRSARLNPGSAGNQSDLHRY